MSVLPVIRPESLVPQNRDECIGDWALIDDQREIAGLTLFKGSALEM
jgi:hypothetical protein